MTAAQALGVRTMNETIGLRVRLTTDVELRGGKKIPRGTVLLVFAHWRGRLTLTTSVKPIEIVVRGLDVSAVERAP